MQDIDFDELDKAVSSVMSDPTPTTPDTQSGAPLATSQPVSEPINAPNQTVTPAEVPSSPAARRSSGRFMDVVHPSSDMRSANRPAMAARGVTAQPTPAVSESPAPESSIDTGIDSPFLSDAKVEKRPLGAFSETTQPNAPVVDLAAALNEELDSPPTVDLMQPAAEPTEPAVMAPAATPTIEGNLIGQSGPDDLAALEVSEEKLLESEPSAQTNATPELVTESSEGTDTPEAPAASTEPEPESKPEPEPEPEPESSQPVDAAASLEAEPASFAPVSIPQQYREQPASPSQPSGAIYDTESYHQPLAHPAKKSSSWTVVLWIIGLIVLGVGAGLLVYFFVLPQL